MIMVALLILLIGVVGTLALLDIRQWHRQTRRWEQWIREHHIQ